jgi:hypothetical protein
LASIFHCLGDTRSAYKFNAMPTLHIERNGPAVSDEVRETIVAVCRESGLVEGGLKIGFSVTARGKLYMLWTASLSVPVVQIIPRGAIESTADAAAMARQFVGRWKAQHAYGKRRWI